MDSTSNYCNEPSVDEGAFWHTNMDLYYGFSVGEVVEVEHESNKYWLATIKYCYRNLILLDWIGKYGEFWVDTSSTNSSTNLSAQSSGVQVPKRLFPPGHHLQSQLKSQYKLEKPTKFLEKPSLYNPSKDPYAEIKTVDDLLAHEPDTQTNQDALVDKSTSETVELVLAKCKTKIDYKQEDVDELEAALQNLNYVDYDESKAPTKSLNHIISSDNEQEASDSLDQTGTRKGDDLVSSCTKDSGISSDVSNQPSSSSSEKDIVESSRDETVSPQKNPPKNECDNDQMHDEKSLDLCKQIQTIAITKGYHPGLSTSGEELTDFCYPLKPKQFYDMGGANQERLFVPGTILEVSHDLGSWFAFIVKNVGGRLTLRWFLCDEPKFKQGRLELKTCKSKHVLEMKEPSAENPDDIEDDLDTRNIDFLAEKLRANGISFAMHFCDPKIQKLGHAKSIGKLYEFPSTIRKFLLQKISSEYDAYKLQHTSHIFESRRIYLDKDRPLIDHILTVIEYRAPKYLDLVFASRDKTSNRQVLISCPKLTKLRKGTVTSELEPGVFIIEIDQSRGDYVMYPYDSTFTVLPLDWSKDNQDCLSTNTSRNTSPMNRDPNDILNESKIDEYELRKRLNFGYPKSTKPNNAVDEDVTPPVSDKTTLKDCLMRLRNSYPRHGGPFQKISPSDQSETPEIKEIVEFDDLDPKCWQDVIRAKELNATRFHCCLDLTLKDEIESKFKIMDEIEVCHPSSDRLICRGRIRKVVFPLLWIELASDHYILVPFNSTGIYPAGWSSANNHRIVSLLNPRKRCVDISSAHQSDTARKRRKAKSRDSDDGTENDNQKLNTDGKPLYEKEHLDLNSLKDNQVDIDYILNERSSYIQIFFNHKCFSGPSLSKSKICSLPQYVGPGPMRLVLEEVVTKVISVGYVPPRILNDLSSKSFEELLQKRGLTNTAPFKFKAKYHKRVHRETIPVCLSPGDVTKYCECLCEHIKCCYNLFGQTLYDGDDCPSHCRSLTKSNKFMKRATYYRDKAKKGEFKPGV